MEPPTRISVVVPAYNASKTLHRLFESLEVISYPAWDVVVVDDGSTDGTWELLESYTAGFEFCRHRAPINEGKGAAINTAVQLASGELTLILDSDDCLTPNALEIIDKAWKSIPKAARVLFAAVEGHSVYLSTGGVIGSRYPVSVFDATHVYSRYVMGVTGDKKKAVRTDLLRRFPAPTFPPETYVPPSMQWNRIGAHYLTRHVDEVIYVKEYLLTGITAQRPGIAIRNPRGGWRYHKELLDVLGDQAPWRVWPRIRAAANAWRFALRAREVRVLWLGAESGRPALVVGAPLGFAAFVRDEVDLRMGATAKGLLPEESL